MSEVATDLTQGVSLSSALANRQEFFPKLSLAVVQAGERGGRLDEAFQRLAKHYDNLVQFRNRFLTSIAWPVFELVAAIVILGLLILIIGFIYDMNGLPPVDWFGLGFGTRGNFVIYVLLVLMAAAAITTLIVGTSRGWFGTLPMRIARRLPLVGPTIEALALSRFAWTASIAENAGMEAGETMTLALRSTQNFFYERLIPEVVGGVRAGGQYYEVLERTSAFPKEFLLLVENGEISGQMAESMDRASHQFQELAETNLKYISTIGFVLMLSFVGIVMAFTIISLYWNLIVAPQREILRDLGY